MDTCILILWNIFTVWLNKGMISGHIQVCIYGTAQRQRRKRTQFFCDLRVRIECNAECVLSMRTSLDFRIL